MIHLTCDVDNLWIYEAEYGRKGRSRFYGHIYETALPQFCELVEQVNGRATFFIVGQDLELPACRAFCEFASKRGHRLANHSHTHAPCFGKMSVAEKKMEIQRADAAIRAVVNQPIVGFRGPGYWLDQDVVDILIQLGYLYDSSVLPGLGTGLMTLYSFASGQRSRGKAYGIHAAASRKVTKLRERQEPDRYVLEIPIATATPLRLPVHSTILFMLGKRGDSYFERVAGRILAGGSPSAYLFHAIDLADLPDASPLRGVVKALDLPLSDRVRTISRVLERLSRFGFQTSEDYLDVEADSFM